MMRTTISIEVEADSARAFFEAPVNERRKLQLLLDLRLRELTTTPVRPLQEVMDEIGTQAEARGLTPERLESLLDGE